VREIIPTYAVLLLLALGLPTVCLADEILRDPTRPYSPKARELAARPVFTLNAVIVSAERRVAIVNGRRVGVGDSVDGAMVIAIEKTQLVLEQDGKRITVALNKGASR